MQCAVLLHTDCGRCGFVRVDRPVNIQTTEKYIRRGNTWFCLQLHISFKMEICSLCSYQRPEEKPSNIQRPSKYLCLGTTVYVLIILVCGVTLLRSL